MRFSVGPRFLTTCLRRALIGFTSLLAVCAGTAHAGESATIRAADAGVDPQFCPALKALVTAAPSGFASLRGAAQDGGENVWQGTRRLPGAGGCLTFGGKPPAYVCTLYAGDAEDNADGVYDRAVAGTKDCLGDWRTTENVRGVHVRTTIATGSGTPTVRVVSHDVSGDAWLVELWVDAAKP